MDVEDLYHVIELCRQAATIIDENGSFRLRVLMQMLLLELENERKAQGVVEQEGTTGRFDA